MKTYVCAIHTIISNIKYIITAAIIDNKVSDRGKNIECVRNAPIKARITCPALILADIRKAKVIGRIIDLNCSILARNGANRGIVFSGRK